MEFGSVRVWGCGNQGVVQQPDLRLSCQGVGVWECESVGGWEPGCSPTA